MNIIMGMCGDGKRFRDNGFNLPKYLIAYHGAPMVYHSLETLNIPGDIYFVVRQDHLNEYSFLEGYLSKMGTVIKVDGKTEGAAQSLLLAKDYIRDLAKPMISVNCDQYMKWNSSKFIQTLHDNPDTSYILTFKNLDPKCSYVKTDDNGYVIEAREKQVISSDATVGVYHWSSTRDFMIDSEQMIKDNIKDNNEYYVAPVYNYSIQRGLKVKTFEVSNAEFFPVGTVYDLEKFIEQDYDK